MARKVRQIRRKGKDIGIVAVPSTAAPDFDARIALIQALIPVALERVQAELQGDVQRLAGERYVRAGRLPGHVRWTPQRGSIYLADQKIPIEVPRVRDRLRNQEVPLPTYERLQAPRALDTGLLHKVARGLVHAGIRALRGGRARSVWAQRVDGLPPLQARECAQTAGIERPPTGGLRPGGADAGRQDLRGR